MSFSFNADSERLPTPNHKKVIANGKDLVKMSYHEMIVSKKSHLIGWQLGIGFGDCNVTSKTSC